MDDLISRQAAIDTLKDVSEHYTDKGREWHPHVDFMVEAIQDLPSAQRWIPVSERLPEIDMSRPHHENYLVQYDSGDMDVASWSNVNRFWTDHVTEPHWNCVQFAEVVAWMPLPEPYQKEGD